MLVRYNSERVKGVNIVENILDVMENITNELLLLATLMQRMDTNIRKLKTLVLEALTESMIHEEDA